MDVGVHTLVIPQLLEVPDLYLWLLEAAIAKISAKEHNKYDDYGENTSNQLMR
jgi:hypothetical protein